MSLAAAALMSKAMPSTTAASAGGGEAMGMGDALKADASRNQALQNESKSQMTSQPVEMPNMQSAQAPQYAVPQFGAQAFKQRMGFGV